MRVVAYQDKDTKLWGYRILNFSGSIQRSSAPTYSTADEARRAGADYLLDDADTFL